MLVYYKCYISIEFNRVSNGTDVNKASASRKYNIYHYQYILSYSFKFQPNAYYKCHDLLMMSRNLSNIAILKIKGFHYRCIISLTSKSEAINLIQNADLPKNSGTL